MSADAASLALPDLAAIRAARVRIAPHVHRTPVLTCRSLDAEAGARLFFKCENFQKIGAFKARGATNAVFALTADQAARGVVTHSSGNHGAALAYAAARRGIPAWVVMPDNAPRVKQDNVRRQGATIRFCAPTAAAREAECAQVQAETGAVLVHPFDNPDVIAGQGTAALELLEDAPDLDAVIAPVGGGGLLSGTAIAAKGTKPGVQCRRRLAELPLRARGTRGDDDHDRRRPAHAAVPAHARRDPRRGGCDRRGERAGDRARDAHDLGAHEDRHRTVVRRAARLPARRLARC